MWEFLHINLCTPWACSTALSAALLLPYARLIRVDQLPLRTTDAIAQVENTKVIILGEGDQHNSLERLAAELGIGDRVTLPGWAKSPRAYLSEFDVVALPSRSEGFPLAMVEAMLSAILVIATRVGSMPEAIIDGETGMLIEKNDVDGLANALRRLRDDPLLQTQLGQQARKKAVSHFTIEAMTASYERFWYKLLDQRRSPRFSIPQPRD